MEHPWKKTITETIVVNGKPEIFTWQKRGDFYVALTEFGIRTRPGTRPRVDIKNSHMLKLEAIIAQNI